MATLQDVSGRVVRTERKWCASGAQEWTLAAPATPGVYLLHLAAQEGPSACGAGWFDETQKGPPMAGLLVSAG